MVCGVFGSTSVPASKASARIGAECGSVAMPGRSSRKNAALLRRNGRWIGNSRMASSSLGGPSQIVSWMYGRATEASAVNVVSRFTNSDACTSPDRGGLAGGVAELLEEAAQPRVAATPGCFATGWRSSSSGTSAAIAVLMSRPRPARPPP